MKIRLDCVDCAISLTLWLSLFGFVAVIGACLSGADTVAPVFRLEYLFFPLMILNNIVTLLVLKSTTKAGKDTAQQNRKNWQELKAILLKRSKK